MMTERHKTARWLAAFMAVLCGTAFGNPAAVAGECRAIHVVQGEYNGPDRFDRGLLWKISAPGTTPSYLFGTIHVADDDVVNLPQAVNEKLSGSRIYVMEALPQAEQATLLSQMMFFDDHRRLNDFLSESMYDKVVQILGTYHLPEETVAILKPWAAFITMSYPADMRQILDLQLLQKALDNRLETRGLETLQEQGRLFNRMAMQDQVTLLEDSVCYHDRFLQDFDVMKSLYLQRDLKGLYLYGQRYSFDDNAVYDSLTSTILTDRNRAMAERIQPILKEGGAFIAIGAMHLPGREGVLALLEKKNYRISRVY